MLGLHGLESLASAIVLLIRAWDLVSIIVDLGSLQVVASSRTCTLSWLLLLMEVLLLNRSEHIDLLGNFSLIGSLWRWAQQITLVLWFEIFIICWYGLWSYVILLSLDMFVEIDFVHHLLFLELMMVNVDLVLDHVAALSLWDYLGSGLWWWSLRRLGSIKLLAIGVAVFTRLELPHLDWLVVVESWWRLYDNVGNTGLWSMLRRAQMLAAHTVAMIELRVEPWILFILGVHFIDRI